MSFVHHGRLALDHLAESDRFGRLIINNLVVIKLNTRLDYQPDNARRFLNRYDNPFAAVGVDAAGRASIDWGVYGVPETFVVNADGIITFKHVGPLTPDAIEAELLPAIEAARG